MGYYLVVKKSINAIDLLLRGDEPGSPDFRRLHKLVEQNIRQTWACPACGSREPKDDNGAPATSDDYTVVCPCGHQFNPHQEET